jgi:hypothetical protein
MSKNTLDISGYLQAMFFDILYFLFTFVFLLLVPQLGNI